MASLLLRRLGGSVELRFWGAEEVLKLLCCADGAEPCGKGGLEEFVN